MAWVYLILAGACEIIWAVSVKYTHGFTRALPSAGTLVAIAASFYFFSRAVQHVPLGTAYAVWTGIGAVGTAVVGMVAYNEPRAALRLVCIFLIIAGIFGLKLTSTQ